MKRIVTITTAAVIAAGAGAGVASAYTSSSSAPTASPVELGLSGLPPERPVDLPALGQPLYGETVSKDDDGAIRTTTWQHGEVTSVSDSSVTVRSADGTEWTWTRGGDTKVYRDGETGSASDIATGDTVRIAGQRDGDVRTASTVTDPPPDFTKLRERRQDLRETLPRLRPN